jgi:hypothetical protein
MKLSDLVDYLNLLDEASFEPEVFSAMRELDSVLYTVNNHEVKFDRLLLDLTNHRNNIDTAVSGFRNRLTELKYQIREQITKQEPKYYQDTSDLFEHGMYYESNEHILYRKLAIDNDSNILIRSKLRNYSDWRIPGMIIRPGLENFVEDMVPLDPLYIIDQAPELTGPAVAKFTAEYQRRLRVYHVNDYFDKETLVQLPDEQFGFVFAYNYFNFRPIEIIQRYLAAVYQKLRPGGTFLFTYNDCDQAHGVALAERKFMCYTPGRVIQEHAEKYGFEILERYRGLGDVAWFELRKPGTIMSMRGGQNLAKIVAM